MKGQLEESGYEVGSSQQGEFGRSYIEGALWYEGARGGSDGGMQRREKNAPTQVLSWRGGEERWWRREEEVTVSICEGQGQSPGEWEGKGWEANLR